MGTQLPKTQASLTHSCFAFWQSNYTFKQGTTSSQAADSHHLIEDTKWTKTTCLLILENELLKLQMVGGSFLKHFLLTPEAVK